MAAGFAAAAGHDERPRPTAAPRGKWQHDMFYVKPVVAPAVVGGAPSHREISMVAETVEVEAADAQGEETVDAMAEADGSDLAEAADPYAMHIEALLD